MRQAAGRALKRKKLRQSAEPCRSSDQSHRLRAFRTARRRRRRFFHKFVGDPNLPDACQHVANFQIDRITAKARRLMAHVVSATGGYRTKPLI